jgi:hypothetical protein
VFVCLAAAACDKVGPTERIGGRWHLEFDKGGGVAMEAHSPNHKNLRREESRRMVLVDIWVARYRHYEPDWLAWTAGGRRDWYFACGNRRPIMLPDWVEHAGPKGVMGIWDHDNPIGWPFIPLDDLMSAAWEQPEFSGNWESKVRRSHFEKHWNDKFLEDDSRTPF